MPTLKEKIRSRNSWIFATAATISTVVLFDQIGRAGLCETFNFEAVDRAVNTWGNNIVMFYGVFVANNILKNILPPKNTVPPNNPENAG